MNLAALRSKNVIKYKTDNIKMVNNLNNNAACEAASVAAVTDRACLSWPC